jgi:hypothetical protein
MSLKRVTVELAMYGFDLMGIWDVRFGMGGVEPQRIILLSVENGTAFVYRR